MADALRIALFNRVEAESLRYREPFEQIGGAVILVETGSWDELREWLVHAPVDLVAVNLGERKDHGLAIVERIGQVAPACSIIGISSNSDPQAIISAMRAGCHQIVTWPVDPNDLRSAVERIRISRQQTAQISKRVCVVGASGGSGATTIACNLAMELAQLVNRRCALVDLNTEFGDVATSFDCAPAHSLGDVCRDGQEVDRLLVGKAVHELPCNVSLLSRPDNLEDASLITLETVDQVLRVLGGMYPFVVADCPRSASVLRSPAVFHADRVLLVTQLGVPFIRNATRIFDWLIHSGIEDSAVEIVLNRCNANFERISPDEVSAHFGRPIFATVPNDYRRVQSSIDLGHPIMADSPSSPTRMAIQEMARRLVQGPAALEPATAAMKSSGILSKLWRK